jgi:ParB family chromosome partitioning protein
MHPADQFVAFYDLVVKSNLSVEEVAGRFGVSPLFVRQRLKLANVSPRFIEAYRSGEMQLDQLGARTRNGNLSTVRSSLLVD